MGQIESYRRIQENGRFDGSRLQSVLWQLFGVDLNGRRISPTMEALLNDRDAHGQHWYRTDPKGTYYDAVLDGRSPCYDLVEQFVWFSALRNDLPGPIAPLRCVWPGPCQPEAMITINRGIRYVPEQVAGLAIPDVQWSPTGEIYVGHWVRDTFALTAVDNRRPHGLAEGLWRSQTYQGMNMTRLTLWGGKEDPNEFDPILCLVAFSKSLAMIIADIERVRKCVLRQ
ncbi:hypothetical protein A2690_02805 [Candidatus Roizmanbacteria bacterium RIFCSPHIGHO2_01_FULL_39_12b]|uniref:Uncharacterized protein n=1 Tax=Candidatus Roizmanbacteria bacterium RIFCSPHIGHO2_01_FULL_39_12b TaxID=1802030 RepID=A0A1F7GBI9_9BACT|nr:MAG: hypothetical protein A2690_02805 [Candidatus Roizmanbacteria bacterium RIFCSPHIGHO2_01_FULL_39_12b]